MHVAPQERVLWAAIFHSTFQLALLSAAPFNTSLVASLGWRQALVATGILAAVPLTVWLWLLPAGCWLRAAWASA